MTSRVSLNAHLRTLLVQPCFVRLHHDRMRGQDSHVTRDGQALLGSQASARQNLTAGRSRAADGSRERHGWSIGVRVRPQRDTLQRQTTRRSISVRVRPPGNWLRSSDYLSATPTDRATNAGMLFVTIEFDCQTIDQFEEN